MCSIELDDAPAIGTAASRSASERECELSPWKDSSRGRLFSICSALLLLLVSLRSPMASPCVESFIVATHLLMKLQFRHTYTVGTHGRQRLIGEDFSSND
uniref:Uncharacterized protein n=1 Tax=Anopheles atroparvus TaxID=41427 RepID=A0AAG5CTF5_ANOAO